MIYELKDNSFRGSEKFTYTSHKPIGIKQILTDKKSNNSVWNNKSNSGGDTEEIKKNIQVKYFRSRKGYRWTNIVSWMLSSIKSEIKIDQIWSNYKIQVLFFFFLDEN